MNPMGENNNFSASMFTLICDGEMDRVESEGGCTITLQSVNFWTEDREDVEGGGKVPAAVQTMQKRASDVCVPGDKVVQPALNSGCEDKAPERPSRRNVSDKRLYVNPRTLQDAAAAAPAPSPAPTPAPVRARPKRQKSTKHTQGKIQDQPHTAASTGGSVTDPAAAEDKPKPVRARPTRNTSNKHRQGKIQDQPVQPPPAAPLEPEAPSSPTPAPARTRPKRTKSNRHMAAVVPAEPKQAPVEATPAPAQPTSPLPVRARPKRTKSNRHMAAIVNDHNYPTSTTNRYQRSVTDPVKPSPSTPRSNTDKRASMGTIKTISDPRIQPEEPIQHPLPLRVRPTRKKSTKHLQGKIQDQKPHLETSSAPAPAPTPAPYRRSTTNPVQPKPNHTNTPYERRNTDLGLLNRDTDPTFWENLDKKKPPKLDDDFNLSWPRPKRASITKMKDLPERSITPPRESPRRKRESKFLDVLSVFAPPETVHKIEDLEEKRALQAQDQQNIQAQRDKQLQAEREAAEKRAQEEAIARQKAADEADARALARAREAERQAQLQAVELKQNNPLSSSSSSKPAEFQQVALRKVANKWMQHTAAAKQAQVDAKEDAKKELEKQKARELEKAALEKAKLKKAEKAEMARQFMLEMSKLERGQSVPNMPGPLQLHPDLQSRSLQELSPEARENERLAREQAMKMEELARKTLLAKKKAKEEKARSFLNEIYRLEKEEAEAQRLAEEARRIHEAEEEELAKALSHKRAEEKRLAEEQAEEARRAEARRLALAKWNQATTTNEEVDGVDEQETDRKIKEEADGKRKTDKRRKSEKKRAKEMKQQVVPVEEKQEDDTWAAQVMKAQQERLANEREEGDLEAKRKERLAKEREEEALEAERKERLAKEREEEALEAKRKADEEFVARAMRLRQQAEEEAAARKAAEEGERRAREEAERRAQEEKAALEQAKRDEEQAEASKIAEEERRSMVQQERLAEILRAQERAEEEQEAIWKVEARRAAEREIMLQKIAKEEAQRIKAEVAAHVAALKKTEESIEPFQEQEEPALEDESDARDCVADEKEDANTYDEPVQDDESFVITDDEPVQDDESYVITDGEPVQDDESYANTDGEPVQDDESDAQASVVDETKGANTNDDESSIDEEKQRALNEWMARVNAEAEKAIKKKAEEDRIAALVAERLTARHNRRKEAEAEADAKRRPSKAVARISDASKDLLLKAQQMKRCSQMFEQLGNLQAQRLSEIGWKTTNPRHSKKSEDMWASCSVLHFSNETERSNSMVGLGASLSNLSIQEEEDRRHRSPIRSVTD